MDKGNRDTIEEIKERIDIVTLVDKYVKLKQAGKNFTGLCPFHNEKTPSFIVSPDIQRYKCFGCGKSGDIFTFVQEIETLDFKQTLEKLAKEAGVEIEQNKTQSKYAWLEWINKTASEFYNQQLTSPVHKDSLEYLKNRGISDESIKTFKIGYAPKHSPLIAYIKNKSQNRLTKDQLLQSGLFVEKQGQLRDKFNDRIVFPIWDLVGKVVGFSGRQTPLNTFGPKYLNTPETALFHKSTTLLGIYQAKNFIRKEDLAVLCEGNLDVISAHQVGIQNLVAPMGTAITLQQVEILRRYTNNILFFFDSDGAGQAAVERGFKITASLGSNSFATNPEPYQDIDEMIQKEPELAKQKIENKIDAFTYLLSSKLDHLSPASSLTDLNELVKYIAGLLSDVENQTTLNFYIQKATTISKVDIKELLDKYLDNKSRPYNRVAKAPVKTSVSENQAITDNPNTVKESQDKQKMEYDLNQILKKAPRRELALIHIVLLHNKFATVRDTDFATEVISEPIIRKLIELIKSSTTVKTADLIKEISEQQQKLILSEFISAVVLDNSLYIGSDPDTELALIYNKLTLESLEKEYKALSTQLAVAEERGDNTEISKLLKKSTELSERLGKLRAS